MSDRLFGLMAGLALWVAAAMMAEAAPARAQDAADVARGQRLFLQCQSCHSVQAGNLGTVGPSLAGVLGRSAGTLPGYAFSSALTASKLVWNEDTLDKWLEHPNSTVPGTKMIFAGVPNQADRAAIIAYLKTFSAAAAAH